MVHRQVNEGEELLTWYGENYGRSLGIDFPANYYDKSPTFGLAPLRSLTNFAQRV